MEGNASTFGGGLYAHEGGSIIISGNGFFGNTSGSVGGGIALSSVGTANLINNIIARNHVDPAARSGAGIAAFSSGMGLTNNTIADNRGDGVWFTSDSSAQIANNIFVRNYYLAPGEFTPGPGSAIHRAVIGAGGEYQIRYNDFWVSGPHYTNVTPGEGNLSDDPLLVRSGDLLAYYHIRSELARAKAGYCGPSARPLTWTAILAASFWHDVHGRRRGIVRRGYLPLARRQ